MSHERDSISYTRSLADARKKVQENPNSLENQFYLGEMLHLAGSYQEAEPVLRFAMELLETQKIEKSTVPYHPRVLEMIDQSTQEARSRMALMINVMLADTLANLNRYFESVEFYENVLKFNTNVPGMWQNYGVALISAGMTKKALRPFREAIRQAPHDKIQWRNIAAAYQELGRNAEFNLCMRVINRSRRIEDDLLDLSELYLYSNDYENCELVLNELLAKNRNDVFALITKARMKVAQQETSEALGLANHVLDVENSHPGALWFKARCYIIEGDFTKGKKLVEQIVTITPEYANAQIVLDELRRMEEQRDSSASTNYRIIIKSQGQSRLVQGDTIGFCPTVRDAFPVVLRFYLASSNLSGEKAEREEDEEIELGEFSYSISHPVDESNYGMLKPVIPEQVIRDGDVLWVEEAQLDPNLREQIRLMNRALFSGKL
jgi:tetratricopeptide (TPR) repeat protein